MLRHLRVHFLRYDVLVVASTLLLLAAWPGLLRNLLDSSFMPHGHCYFWQPSLVWLHVSTDFVIGLSYVAIAATLAWLVHRARRDIPFSWMFLAFGLFIITCGGTHFMGVWTLWNATYWLSGSVKMVTAVASVATALSLPPLVPKVMGLIRAEKLAEERRLELETANSELTGLYQRLRELDQLKTDFFANVSHDLRTPLSLILAPAERLSSDAGLEPRQREDVELVERNARLLLHQVEDLLQLAQLEAGRLELELSPVDASRLIRLTTGYFEGVARDRGVDLAVEAPPVLVGRLDVEKIQRILVNLIGNALDFVPDGGVVRVAAAAADGEISIEVRDSGPGVPLALRESIFDRFRQADGGPARRVGGSGLGLAIARELAELHGGSVTVGDAPEGGACFRVRLPLAPPAAEPPREAAEPPELPATRVDTVAAETGGPGATTLPVPAERPDAATVLVIEDNPDMLRFLASSLSDDYRVLTAYEAMAGLEAAEAHIPDLIVTDLMMPQMTGEELVAEVRRRPALADVPIVVLTAKTDEETRIRLLGSGAQDYLLKPFRIGELHRRIDNLLSAKRVREMLQTELASQAADVEELTRELIDHTRDAEQARLKAEEASRLKDEFLAVVSHELRTPLHSMLGWTQVLRARPTEGAERDRILATIERNGRAQAQLIDDLLDVSRIVTGRFRMNVETVSLDRVILDALEAIAPAASAKELRVRRVLASDAGPVSGDPDRLRQVVWNLLSNAVKFTPKGGRVDVRLERFGSRARLEVSDNGPGIPGDFLPFVFDPFRQADASTSRQQQGLGLGLSVARHLVELHGGTIDATNRAPGEGAVFTVELPLRAVQGSDDVLARLEERTGPSSVPTAETRPLTRLDGLRVLLVEDDDDSRELLVSILEDAGAEVTAASHADEALERLESARPHVLLSDVGLPGEDGYSLLRRLRQHERDRGREVPPAAAITAFARSEDRLEALAAGFQLHLPKPVDPIELVMVTASLAGRAGEP